MIRAFLLVKIAIITLTRTTDDDASKENLRDELQKAITSTPLTESWHIEAVSILDDAILPKNAEATIKTK
jgi:hypothetical protein